MADIYINRPFTAYVGSTPVIGNSSNGQSRATQSPNNDFESLFQQNLQKAQSNLVFSKHAMQRISGRQIELTPTLLSQITNAVQRAEEKGVREALIVNSQTAFIVNIPSKTVITTMNAREMKENIITNIDGTVFI